MFSDILSQRKLTPQVSVDYLDDSMPGPSSRPLRSATLQQLHVAESESPAPSTTPSVQHPPHGLRIRHIRVGQYDIDTWYDAPFPEEYSNIPDGRIWICEFCLKYMKSEFMCNRHRVRNMHLGYPLFVILTISRTQLRSNAKLGIHRVMRSTGTAMSRYLKSTVARTR